MLLHIRIYGRSARYSAGEEIKSLVITGFKSTLSYVFVGRASVAIRCLYATTDFVPARLATRRASDWLLRQSADGRQLRRPERRSYWEHEEKSHHMARRTQQYGYDCRDL